MTKCIYIASFDGVTPPGILAAIVDVINPGSFLCDDGYFLHPSTVNESSVVWGWGWDGIDPDEGFAELNPPLGSPMAGETLVKLNMRVASHNFAQLLPGVEAIPALQALCSSVNSSVTGISATVSAMASTISALNSSVSSLAASIPAASTATPANVAAAGLAGVASTFARGDHAHKVPDIAPNSAPGRSLNSTFTPSATKQVLCLYAVQIVCSASLAGGQNGRIRLLSDPPTTPASNPTTVRGEVQNQNSVSLAIALTAVNGQTGMLAYLCPAGHTVRLETAQTLGAPTFSLIGQCEIPIG